MQKFHLDDNSLATPISDPHAFAAFETTLVANVCKLHGLDVMLQLQRRNETLKVQLNQALQTNIQLTVNAKHWQDEAARLRIECVASYEKRRALEKKCEALGL